MTNRERRKELTRQRAETFFGIYYEMGAGRSLQKLAELCSKIGLKRALSTFTRWSVEHGWQNRILEVDSKLQATREASHFAKIQVMNERQAQDARNLQALGRAGMTGLVNIMKQTGQLELGPQDIVTLIREGAKLERLALGEVTDRTEMIVLVYNVMLLGVVEIFKEANLIRDPEERVRMFAQRVDEFRDRKLLILTSP